MEGIAIIFVDEMDFICLGFICFRFLYGLQLRFMEASAYIISGFVVDTPPATHFP